MAFIEPKSQFQQNLDYLSGSGPIPLSGGSPSTGGSEGMFPVQAESTAAPAATGVATAAASQPRDQSQSIDAIFNPYQGRLSDLESGVQQGLSDFRSQAGPARSYESVGAAEKLGQALADPNERNIGQARDFVNASYSGPTQFDPEAAQRLASLSQDLGDFSTGLRGGGLADIVQQSSPGLSQGQARQEAQFLSQDPAFQDRLRSFSGRISSARSQLPSAQAQARDFATERADQERTLAESSRDFLNVQEATTKAELDRKVEELTGANRALSGVYEDFSKTGDLGILSTAGFDADRFRTPTRQAVSAAEARRNEILASNPDYSSYSEQFGDPLTLGVSSRGREKFRLNPDLKQSLVDEGTSKRERRQIKKGLIGTQKELESEFSPKVKRVKEPGQYSVVDPLYFGSRFEPPAAQNYIHFDPGVSPARENVSTDQQRQIINTVNEILDEGERLTLAGEPFRAAQLVSNVERFLEDEKIALDAQEGELTAAAKKWRNEVNKARRQYRKSKKLKSAANLGGVPGSSFKGTFGGLFGDDVADKVAMNTIGGS